MYKNNTSYLSPAVQAIAGGVSNAKVDGLRGPGAAVFMALLKKRIKKNFLVITPAPGDAETFLSDLRFFYNDFPIYLYPTREILPYEELDPDPLLTSQRIGALHALLYREDTIVVTSTRAVMDRVLPRQALGKGTGYYGIGETVSRERIVRQLLEGGYRSVPLVEEHGEFSVRGAILDFSPPDWEHGCRIEFFGDEIESIRRFDCRTQRSLENMDEAIILPVREVILNQERARRMIHRIEEEYSASRLYQTSLAMICERMERQETFPGIDFHLPYLYPYTETIFSYLTQKGVVCLYDQERIMDEANIYEGEIRDRFHKAKLRNFPYPQPEEVFLLPDKLEEQLMAYQRLIFSPLKAPDRAGKDGMVFPYAQQETRGMLLKEKADIQKRGVFASIVRRFKDWQREGKRVILTCLSDGQAERLVRMLDEYEMSSQALKAFPLECLEESPTGPVPVSICLGDLSMGVLLDFLDLVLVTDEEIFGEKVRVPALKIHRKAKILASFTDLKVNDYVVHVEHGIALYKGLIKLKVDGMIKDFLLLEFRDGDKLYCPPENLELVQKYTGSGDIKPELDKLGGKHWVNLKARVKKSIQDMAMDLLRLYAAREMAKGFACPVDNNWQREFEAAFEYEETPDQMRAIIEVKKDMEGIRPMDRLVCGDVGYGKTEVAMRAAFKAVMGGKQVAMLAPTTVLVQQHFQKFTNRMAPYPVKVQMLSRFVDKKEQKAVLAGLENGDVDIVIGTHRLIQKDVKFKELGLIIIDEEQRFGVKHKERLKELRKEVDCLTLTATPIPRTLHMSMTGIRDMSIIDTPPEDRLPITTYITHFDPDLIAEACQRELDRGGQVFYVYNRVEGIEDVANFVRTLMPHARIGIGHGQMPEKGLEKVMLDFVHKKHDILVCTTIIESGLDIPSANTIIVHQADRFGLAQLYQLRGRVGRSSHRAYAYLLVPSDAGLTDEAKKRLAAIQDLTELGSGFRLAARDLEIRGAGNLLGSRQHGHIAAVGYDLYCDLIRETMGELKGEPVEKTKKVEINMNLEAFLPEDYVPDVNQRLNIYKRASMIEGYPGLDALRQELRDRYGALPEAAENLMRLIETKIMARRLGIEKLERHADRLRLNFSQDTPVQPQTLLQMVMQDKGKYRLIPPSILEMRLNHEKPALIFEEIISWAQTFKCD
ncbi:transcription-repair coupling factor [bacterium]|nr:transcription-repair coupling factor [bacterium]